MKELELIYEQQVVEASLFGRESGKPRWGQVMLDFEDDNDRGLYIATSKTPSQHQQNYIKALTDAGMKIEDIQNKGFALRQTIKRLVGPDNQTPRTLRIPSSNKPSSTVVPTV